MQAAKPKTALLRVTTAGSVDDGKSTLIGRLLYESQAILDDQLKSIERGHKGPDLSLVTDGLKSEREQGITIDVAYKYFASSRTKFILADAPGHLQYTRNMVTAASTADVGIVLVDARHGLTEQTRRHAYILHLLGVTEIILAINKVDLIEYNRQRIDAIATEFKALPWLDLAEGLHVVPISALVGDNVTTLSPHMPWYQGEALAPLLDSIAERKESRSSNQSGFELPLQHIVRSRSGERIPLGTLSSGSLRPGDSVRVLPSGTSSRVTALWRNGNVATLATAGDTVALTLADQLDLERGYLLVHEGHDRHPARHIKAHLVWFDDQSWQPGKQYLLRTGTQKAGALVTGIDHRFDLANIKQVKSDQLRANDIGTVDLELTKDLYLKPFATDHRAGAFILVDKESFRTVAAGMITELKLSSDATTRQTDDFPSLTTLQIEVLNSLREQGWEVTLTRRPKLREHLQSASATETPDASGGL